MPVRVKIEAGAAKVRLLLLAEGDTLVGRHDDCKLRIPSAEVSRRHCILRVKKNRLIVVDLDSANGTLVNGRFVEGQIEVETGDKIQIGPVSLVIEIQAQPAKPGSRSKKTPSPSDSELAVELVDSSTELAEVLPADSPGPSGGKSAADEFFMADLADNQEEGLVPLDDDQEVVEGIELLDESEKIQLPRKKNIREIFEGLDDDSGSQKPAR